MINNDFLINNFSRKSKHFSRNLFITLTLLISLLFSIFIGLNYFTYNSNATLVGFDPGNIMDDATMANKSSMSEKEIQTFLDSKIGSLKKGSPDGYGVSPNGYTYHIENGYYVPLSKEKFGNNGLPAKDGQTAARIIWQAAQDYSINPQVLLVILQKEQSLITDNWPNYKQYQMATGFGCPDTAACDPNYGGFIAQVRNAAAFFRTVLNGGWSNYPVGLNYVQYHPNKECGGKVITIANKATSALYRYTPYQPNTAAMSAGWGIGDNCSSYGNRNFYNYFTDWFGSTKSDVFIASPGPVNLASGTYLIASTQNRALDIKSAGTSNGTLVQSYPLNATAAQFWIATRLPNGYYTFKNPNSNKCLDVFNGGVYNGSEIGLWECAETSANQQFAISPNSSGGYFIQAKVSGKVLDISGNSFSAGAKITTWSKATVENQSWNFYPTDPVSSGDYTLTNYMSKKSLDAAGGKINIDGTDLQIWEQNKTIAQIWTLRNNNNGTYSIINKNSRKTLDIRNGKINTNDSQIQLWVDSKNNAQVWNIAAASGGYTFINPWSRKVIDISGGQIYSNGSKIKLWHQNGYDSQTWTLTKI